jgi:DNA repair photolyase
MYLNESHEAEKHAIHGTEPEEVESKAIQPLFGTKEWAPYSENCVVGCSHDCRYCYAKAMAIHYERSTPQEWKNEKLRPNILQKKFHKREGAIMFPSSHDITPAHLSECLTFLKNIFNPRNEVLIVTKPHLECIKAICEEFSWSKDKILFRFTIGSTDPDTLKFWELHAPDFQERMASLQYAFRQGYKTSVSCEPMLDGNMADLIRQTSPFITDAVWLGKMNRLLYRLRINGEDDPITIAKARQLIKLQSNGPIWGLYLRYKNNPKVKWKDSIKKVVGLVVATQPGSDK